MNLLPSLIQDYEMLECISDHDNYVVDTFDDVQDLPDIQETYFNNNIIDVESDPINTSQPIVSITPDTNIKPLKRESSVGRKNKKVLSPLYACDNCNFTTRSKNIIHQHRLIHTLDCPFCPFKTVRENYLTVHIKDKHLDDKGRAKNKWLSEDGGFDLENRDFIMLDLANHQNVESANNHEERFQYLSNYQMRRPSVIRNANDNDVKIAHMAYVKIQEWQMIQDKNNL